MVEGLAKVSRLFGSLNFGQILREVPGFEHFRRRLDQVNQRVGGSADPFLRYVIIAASGSAAFLVAFFLVAFFFTRPHSGADVAKNDLSVQQVDRELRRSEKVLAEEGQKYRDQLRDEFIAQYRLLLEDESGLRQLVSDENSSAITLALQREDEAREARRERAAAAIKKEKEALVQSRRDEKCNIAFDKFEVSKHSMTPVEIAESQKAIEDLCSSKSQ